MKMVERMARAMCEADGFVWDDLTDFAKNASGSDNDQENYFAHALAALKAMRDEPSNEVIMALAGFELADIEEAFQWIEAYQAMIDAAIKEAESE